MQWFSKKPTYLFVISVSNSESRKAKESFQRRAKYLMVFRLLLPSDIRIHEDLLCRLFSRAGLNNYKLRFGELCSSCLWGIKK